MGQFLGFSGGHSFLVPNVQHISTVYISPQFHLVFDGLFEMFIFQGDNDSTIEEVRSDTFDVN